jgi:glycosyltransferase involved in cell wall biosynthesis
MRVYGDQISNSISPLLRPGEEIVDCLPENVRLRPKWKRYWDQYVRYQRFAAEHHGDVNHIIDHGYGHLVRSLPPNTAVVTFHDATVARLNGTALTTRASLRYSLAAMRRAARIVTVSQVSRCDLLRLIDYPEHRLRVIYSGIDPAFRVMEDRERLRATHGLPSRYLLHVGHCLPYMNVEHVLRSLRILLDGGNSVVLVKVGDQFTGSQARLIDSLGLCEQVRHMGRVPLAQLPVLYNCAEVLLYPVHYAGFGFPPLEAMACGVPVVCSDRGALPEVLGDAALMADPANASDIADKVAQLLAGGPLCETYRVRGLARAKRYCWVNTAREMLGLYREVGHA